MPMTAEEALVFYGATPAEWLRRWDAGETVWTIEMGGLGPAYEQCIHITCAEILRHVLAANYDVNTWEDDATWQRDRDQIRTVMKLPVIHALGLSGAQWGAAANLALMLYRKGPAGVMLDPVVADRHIQVRRTFP